MKRLISMLLAIAMTFGMLPVGEMVAIAAEGDATVKKIIVNKTYESIEDYGTFFITITGDNLNKADVRIMEAGGELIVPKKSSSSSNRVAQYSYPASNIGQRLFIDGDEYTLGEEDIPRITGRDGATSKIVKSGKDVVLTGEKIENLKDLDKKIDGYFSQSSTKSKISNEEVVGEGDNAKIKKNVGTVLGSHSLVFQKKTEENNIPIEIEHTYKSIIIVRGDLTVTGEASIFPSQGTKESLVTITADKIESNVSVFLMKKGDEYKYTKENMAPIESVSHTRENGKEKIKFKVPKGVKNGLHEVVLTNKIDPNKNIDNQISKYKTIGNGTGTDFKSLDFNVVDGTSGVDLNKIDPNFSSIKGIPAKIEGRNIVRISPNLYESKDDSNGIANVDISDNKRMVVNFKEGKYNDKEVKGIKRTITVQIGTNAVFTGYDTKGSIYDYLDVIVPENDDLDKPVKDVIVFITNEIEFKDGTKATITEGDTIENGFTYNPIDYQPKVTKVLPDTIPVDSLGKVTDDFVISITGENFLKYGYVKDKVLKTKTPIISVDKQGTSQDWFDNDNIRLYDKSGKLLEEKEGEQFASIIKIKIKKGEQIPSTIVDSTQKLKVQNPLAVESAGDMGSSAFGEIKFVKVEADDTPIIIDVSPSTITTDGADNIVIKGTNFRENVKIILDGEEIKGFKRNGVGTELIFKAPAKPEDTYQIIVQNGNGGAATFDKFEYVQTRTSPKLDSFSPKAGTRETLVTVKGKNFVSTDPLVKNISGSGINRLIGTRVLLGGVDVNEYNKDKEGNVLLKDFKPSEGIVTNKDDIINMAPYSNDVVLVEDKGGSPSDKYFKIYKSVKTDKVILTDGRTENELYVKSGKIYVDYNNGEREVISNKNEGKITIKQAEDGPDPNNKDKNRKDLILNIKTPYLIGDKIIRYDKVNNNDGEEEYILSDLGKYVKDTTVIDKEKQYIKISEIKDIDKKKKDLEIRQGIIGNNVKVSDNNNPENSELTFIVPEKMKEGFYDVTIVNPDTKSDSKTGKNGFYYYLQPQKPISITKIYPDKGSTEGGYYIDIEGTNFKDNGGGDKPKVVIGGVEINPKDIEVSPNGQNLRVKVPKYPGDLNAESDIGRKTVAVVVVNPDGASASVQEGFTYIVPKSNPKIKDLVPDKGSAAGGEEITIYGSDFRFYEPYVDLNGNNKWDDKGESDTDGDGLITNKDPAEPFDDLNEDGTWTDLDGKEINKLTKNDRKILPTIYFGNKEAEIIYFEDDNEIQVKVPAGVEGTVDVYIVNNDYGASNKIKYKYVSSKPGIKSITPKVGKKQGNDKVEIIGSEFHNTPMRVIRDNKNNIDNKNMPLVQFGDIKDKSISNSGIAIDKQYSGQILRGKSTVKVGNLIVEYASKGSDKNLTFKLDQAGNNKVISFDDYDDKVIFFPMSLLDSKLHEYVRVSLVDVGGIENSKRVRVDRGFSPETKLENSGHISLKTPSYYTIGKTKVTIINPDGGTGQGDFEYKNPDSRPLITEILKDSKPGQVEDGVKVVKVNTKGGNVIDVIGSDFRKPVKITIGEISINQKIEYNPKDTPISQKATFTMPKVDDKYADGKLYPLILENEDGGVISSSEAKPQKIYIKFFKGESNPEITSIDPKTGPSKGGTKVTIKGKDFRKTMEGFEGKKLKVYFDDEINVEEGLNVKVIDIETIEVTSPANKTKIKQVEPVEATIKIENPDGSIALSKDKFIYTGPTIDSIIKAEGTSMGDNIVYIEGRQFEFHGLAGKAMEDLTAADIEKLPKIYFGKNKAEILSFTEESDGVGQTIELKVPKGSNEVDVYIENSNGEESARVKYSYIATTPTIDYVSPGEAPNKGAIKAEIFGSGFYESKLRVYEIEKDEEDTELLSIKEKSMMVVQFAEAIDSGSYENISNKNITGVNDKNVGIFSNNKTKEINIGNITVEYNGKDEKQLKVSLEDNGNVYEESFEYDKAEVYVPLSLLKDYAGKAYDGNELVKISQSKLQGTSSIYRLVVERGYAESAKLETLEDETQKIVIDKIPGYYENKSIKIEVTNPDGESVDIDFDYKNPPSNPEITGIKDPLNNDVKKETLSIDGGETIKIKGKDFLNNEEGYPNSLRVVFNPILEKVKDSDQDTDIITIKGERYKLISGDIVGSEDGEEGSDVSFIDEETLIVNNTPLGKIGASGVIVINPDNAASPTYDINYGIPEITSPQKVRATLIKNEYIRINWDQVIDKPTEADGKKVQYEVFLITNGSREFLGSTGTTGYIFNDLKPNTTYEFLVRAVGKSGSSKPITESISNKVTTGKEVGSTNPDKEPGKGTKVEKVGDVGKVVIGSDAFDDANEYVIDLTRGMLAGSKKAIVSMSASVVVTGKNNKIKIIANDYILTFSPNVFENSVMRDNRNKSSAGVKFEVSPTTNNFELSTNKAYTVLSSSYLLGAKTFVGASSQSLEVLNGKMNLALNYDENLAVRRRINKENINLVKYDLYNKELKEVFGNNSSYGTSIGDLNELGTYTITGSRR